MKHAASMLAALTLASSLLAGCGQPGALSPAAPSVARLAARSAAAPKLPATLRLEDVAVHRGDHAERITLLGRSGTRAVSLSVTSFFPYYIPMYSEVLVNGKARRMDQETAQALVKLLNQADKSKLSESAAMGLRMALYGLEFAARHGVEEDAR